MYKAIKEIGGYKIGEEIPKEKALIWINMYSKPHIELVDSEPVESKKDSIESNNIIEDFSEDDPMLDDYLARSTNVVKNNLSKDNISNEKLEKLLKLEKSNKNRSSVIKSINKKLLA